MKEKVIMGIDIGTQSIRVGLFTEKGKLIAISSESQYMKTPKPGWAVQEPNFWWESIVRSIKKVISESSVSADNIVSIGACAVMHSPVPVKLDGTLLSDNVQMYCDKRASDIVEKIKSDYDINKIFHKTANMPTSNWFGLKVKWIQENEPEVYESADKFLTPKDFINFKLTGETYIDYSEAAGSFLMDAETQKWSDDIIKLLALDKEKLPTIAKASEVIGEITQKAASETGLRAGTPVVAGAGDMFCSLLTSGMTKYGSVVDITGTGSIICYLNENPIFDKKIMNIRHVTNGWVAFGCIDSSGGAFRWFRDVLGKKETEIAHSKNIDEYEYMSELASKVEYGSEGVIFYPYLMGERTLGSPYSRATFLGMNPGTTTGHMVRAILEGISFEHKRTLEIMEQDNRSIDAVYHNGGGAKGELWSQIKADIYQKPVYTLEDTEGGVLGAAILAGVGVGVYSSEAEGAERIIKVKKEFTPDASKAERYNSMFEIYKEVHDLLQKPFDRMAKLF